MKKIIVIGGGIGGLCTTLMLQKNGDDVQLFEAAAQIKAVGAGIGVGSNALAALYETGVGEQIEQRGNPLHEMIFQNEQGVQLNKMDFTKFAQEFGLNSFTIHRADLHHVLYQSIKPNTIHLNKRCFDFKQTKTGVEVYFDDSTQVEGDIIIAADGIHSVFRNKLIPHAKTRYAGYTCWRGVVETDDHRFTKQTSYELWGRAGRIGIVPLKGKQVYWFACVNGKPNDPKYKNRTPMDVAQIFSSFPEHITQLIRLTKEDELLHHDIYDLKPLNQFVYGRIVLLGDAAHATTPNMGQGAGQALEDAIVFVKSLNKEKDLHKAFNRYENKRIKRTKKIIKMSRNIGIGAQLENPFAIAIRNKLFPYVPSAILLQKFKYLLNIDLS
ncbi:MAG TPA: FAD-dependent monooxygenase [Virgibacillus sp.]|nr:FAD-dependent monooxygenase [Virgibacillus sp.]HLR68025.1 FAD-dependent monooxygenase [Virgibacillus sp.]